jgi:hypothetical protein
MSEAALRSQLPDPAPGFPGLVGIHLRLLVREARLGSAILALVCVALPLAAALNSVPDAGAELPHRIHLLAFAAMGLTAFLAVLWPESVWRGLRPGRRLVLDALPAGRRAHRMARVVAGAALPLALLGSLALTWWIIEVRGFNDALPISADDVPGLQGAAIIATLLWVLTLYSISSIFAIRFGKVFLGLLITATVIHAIPLLLMIAGFDELVMRIGQWTTTSALSPLRFLLTWYQLDGSDILPGLGWLALFGGTATWLAGRHDRP